jgi:CBS domain
VIGANLLRLLPDNVQETGVSPGGGSRSPSWPPRRSRSSELEETTWSRAGSEVFVPYRGYPRVRSGCLGSIGSSCPLQTKIMADRWIRHLPVVDGGKLVGVISKRGLADVLAGALNEPEALQQRVEASELSGNAGFGPSRKVPWDQRAYGRGPARIHRGPARRPALERRDSELVTA